MSLYNNVSDTLISRGLLGGLQDAANGALNTAGGMVADALGGGEFANMVGGLGALAGQNAINRAIDENIPFGMRRKIDVGSSVVGNLMQGDFDAAAMDALSLYSPEVDRMRDRSIPTPMLNGMSLVQAQRLYGQVSRAGHVRKNLFVFEVQSNAEGNQTSLFNMFAIDVDYEPFNIAADKQRLGGAVVDVLQGQEAVEMRLTTYDNERGDMKRFFARHHAMMAARDGTVGLPAQYALKIKVLHGVVRGGASEAMSYADSGLFRVTTVSENLSRRDIALQELQVTLSQLDTFVRA